MSDSKKFFKSIAGKNNQIYDYVPAIAPTGDFQKIDGINVLINSIRTLLLTPLGFYPFDPNYGSLLYKKVFEQLDDNSKLQIEDEVRYRVRLIDERVNVDSVEITQIGSDGKSLQVNVYIKRGDVTGKVTVNMPGPTQEFGLETSESL